MPLYEYSCQSCGEKEEMLEAVSAPMEHDCAHCGTPKGMRREVSLTSFTLAGGGWHAQGYSGPGKKIDGPAKAESTTSPAAPAAGGGCAGGCACHSAKPGK